MGSIGPVALAVNVSVQCAPMPATAKRQQAFVRRVAGSGLLVASASFLGGVAVPARAVWAQEQAPAQGDSAPPGEPAEIAPLEVIVLALVNGARTNAGVHSLEWDAQMTAAARSHARDMMQRSHVSHTGSDGSSPQQRLRRAGVQFQWGSENIWTYWGRVPDEGPRVMHAEMMSEPHRPDLWNHIRNILHPGYRRIGVGISVNQRGVQYLSEKFAD
jgi:uncharacterized protein YkwD